MVIDKAGIGIILLIIVFGGSAALLIMGTVPEIFRQGEQQDDTEKIINETNKSMLNLEKHLFTFIQESENRSATGAAERKAILNNISAVLDSLSNKSADHEKFSINVNTLQESLNKISLEIQNVTEDNRKMLGIYGENSIEKFDLLISKLDNISKQLSQYKYSE
jgi:ABC-type transporter Mla subunit MlaD